jgi:hypothetical protein
MGDCMPALYPVQHNQPVVAAEVDVGMVAEDGGGREDLGHSRAKGLIDLDRVHIVSEVKNVVGAAARNLVERVQPGPAPKRLDRS